MPPGAGTIAGAADKVSAPQAEDQTVARAISPAAPAIVPALV
jgi:hypothetical protein